MRPLGLVSIVAACFLAAAGAPTAAAMEGAAIADSTTAAGAATAAPVDSAGWLPMPIEDQEDLDQLEGRDMIRGLGVRADVNAGRLSIRRAAGEGTVPAIGLLRIAWLARESGRGRLTAGVGGAHATGQLAVGALVLRGEGALLAEALGLSGPTRTPRSPRAGTPWIDTPRGRSSLATRGFGARIESRGLGAWALTGRSETNDRVVAAGVTARIDSISIGAAAGSIRRTVDAGARQLVSIAASRPGDEGTTLAGELLVSRGHGPEALGEIGRWSGPLHVSARWRRRPGERRPVAGALVAETRARAARARVTWRPWSSRASRDDGRAEIEGVWRAPGLGIARVRIGVRGESDGASGPLEPAGNAERFLLADFEIARERGRSLSLLASRREARDGGGRSVGSMLGGRLEVTARGRAGLTLLTQATRAPAAGGAWAAGLTPSGESALVVRGRSGVSVTGRGWVQLGSMRLEAAMSDVDASSGGRPAAASFWIQWIGEK